MGSEMCIRDSVLLTVCHAAEVPQAEMTIAAEIGSTFSVDQYHPAVRCWR